MKRTKLINKRTAKSERGAAMIDYAILVSMVAVVSLGGLISFGNSVQKVFCEKIMKIAYLEDSGDVLIKWEESNPKNKYCMPYTEAEDGSPDKLF